ncbi:kinesin-like protein KIF18A isoform X2 [Daktulosphaira vitifoliae]|uniref:kinesin-like protein KIF18A isoform X2 n=1 Tax=Daktulosphaira vitifoliae TaxID=58002 RepID=UPI0021A981BE|nr:kinesin-like protein KIF18A isoform X2 [Daktulosphaira vitifoliae]
MVLNRRSLENLKKIVPGRGKATAQEEQMRVFVRIKPLVYEDGNPKPKTIKVRNEYALIFDPKQDETPFFFHGVKQNPRDISKKQHKSIKYDFHRVFGPESTNEDIYNESTKDLLDKLLNGYNCSVFVYGATGAGKTFTMLGNDSNYGITYLTMKDLYEKVNEQQETKKFEIYVSYLEVYNEMVYDLLVNEKKPLFLRECGNTTSVAGISIKMVNNVDELIEMLRRGNDNRTQHPTDANAESSRSHALFQVYIQMTYKHTDQVKMAKLSMVDLAGSERASSNKGMRFKEGSNINKSLLALGNCINNLSDGLRHIPYRDSKLTRLLKDSLGGNCKTLMISCVSPEVSSYEDTHNTLKYAARAMKIKSNLKENVLSVNHPPAHYLKIISGLEDEVQKLKTRYEDVLKSKSPLPPDNLEDLKNTLETLFTAKLKKHVEILRLESAQKKTELRIFLKKSLIERYSLFDSQNGEEMVNELNRINMAIQQFEGRMASINAQLNILWDEALATNNELQTFLKKLEEDNVKQFLDVDITSYDAMIVIEEKNTLLEHRNEIGMILDSNFHISQELNKMFAEKTNEYYSLLEAHNKATEEMKKSHSNMTKSFLGGLKAVSWDFSPGNQCKINRDAYFNLTELSIDNLRNCTKPGNSLRPNKIIKLEAMSPVQTIENKLQNITIQSDSNVKMEISPETSANETVVISNQAESLNNTFVLKQNADAALNTNKRQATTTPHRSKPPIDTRCLTKSITKPTIQRKRVVLNNHKTGHVARNINQENFPLLMAATKTLADPILAKTVTKTRAISSNVLSAKSGNEIGYNK